MSGYDHLESSKHASAVETAITGDLASAIEGVVEHPTERWMQFVAFTTTYSSTNQGERASRQVSAKAKRENELTSNLIVRKRRPIQNFTSSPNAWGNTTPPRITWETMVWSVFVLAITLSKNRGVGSSVMFSKMMNRPGYHESKQLSQEISPVTELLNPAIDRAILLFLTLLTASQVVTSAPHIHDKNAFITPYYVYTERPCLLSPERYRPVDAKAQLRRDRRIGRGFAGGFSLIWFGKSPRPTPGEQLKRHTL